MKIKIMLAAATLAAGLASPALAGDPTGLWQTPTNGGQVRISRCGQALCGVLVTSDHIRADANARDEHNRDAAQRNRTLRNLPMLTGFTGAPRATLNVTVAGPTKQIQGLYQIVNPDSGSISNHVMVRPGTN